MAINKSKIKEEVETKSQKLTAPLSLVAGEL